jgi:hypothetical protein
VPRSSWHTKRALLRRRGQVEHLTGLKFNLPADAKSREQLDRLAAARRLLAERVPVQANGNPFEVIHILRAVEQRAEKKQDPMMGMAAREMRERWEQDWGILA